MELFDVFGDYAANDVAAQFDFAPRTSTSAPTASVSAKYHPVHSPSPELETVSHTPNTKDKSAQQLQADDCVQVITGIWLQSFEFEEDTSKCAVKWFDFGVALGISPSALSALRSKQPEQRLYDVILKAEKLNLLSPENFLQAVETSFGASFIKDAAEQLNTTLPETEALSSPSPVASVVSEPSPVVSPEPGVATSARVSDAESVDGQTHEWSADEYFGIAHGCLGQLFASGNDVSACHMKWFDFGIYLGIPWSEVRRIRARTPEERLYDVIEEADKMCLLSPERFVLAVEKTFGSASAKEAAQQLNLQNYTLQPDCQLAVSSGKTLQLDDHVSARDVLLMCPDINSFPLMTMSDLSPEFCNRLITRMLNRSYLPDHEKYEVLGILEQKGC